MWQDAAQQISTILEDWMAITERKAYRPFYLSLAQKLKVATECEFDELFMNLPSEGDARAVGLAEKELFFIENINLALAPWHREMNRRWKAAREAELERERAVRRELPLGDGEYRCIKKLEELRPGELVSVRRFYHDPYMGQDNVVFRSKQRGMNLTLRFGSEFSDRIRNPDWWAQYLEDVLPRRSQLLHPIGEGLNKLL